MRSPIIFRKVCTKIIKTIAYNTKRRSPRFRKNEKLLLEVLGIARNLKRIEKSQSTERSLRSLAQPKRDSAFEQKTRIVPSRETSGSSQYIVFSYNQKKAKHSSNRRFWDVLNVFLESWCFPFGEIAHYLSEGLYENHQNNCIQYKTTEPTFPKK